MTSNGRIDYSDVFPLFFKKTASLLLVQIVKLYGVLLWVGEFEMYWRTVDIISDDENYRPILQAVGVVGGLLSAFGNVLINQSMCVFLDVFYLAHHVVNDATSLCSTFLKHFTNGTADLATDRTLVRNSCKDLKVTTLVQLYAEGRNKSMK